MIYFTFTTKRSVSKSGNYWRGLHLSFSKSKFYSLNSSSTFKRVNSWSKGYKYSLRWGR